MKAEPARTMLVGAHLSGARITSQIFQSLRPAEAGTSRELAQGLGKPDVQALDKVGLEQGFDDGLGAALVAGEADQPMGAQRVWRVPDSFEREFDAFGASRGSDRRIQPLGLSGAAELGGEVNLAGDPLARQIGIELERPPRQGRAEVGTESQRALEPTLADEHHGQITSARTSMCIF